jgi:hypothetical protein
MAVDPRWRRFARLALSAIAGAAVLVLIGQAYARIGGH